MSELANETKVTYKIAPYTSLIAGALELYKYIVKGESPT